MTAMFRFLAHNIFRFQNTICAKLNGGLRTWEQSVGALQTSLACVGGHLRHARLRARMSVYVHLYG